MKVTIISNDYKSNPAKRSYEKIMFGKRDIQRTNIKAKMSRSAKIYRKD